MTDKLFKRWYPKPLDDMTVEETYSSEPFIPYDLTLWGLKVDTDRRVPERSVVVMSGILDGTPEGMFLQDRLWEDVRIQDEQLHAQIGDVGMRAYDQIKAELDWKLEEAIIFGTDKIT